MYRTGSITQKPIESGLQVASQSSLHSALPLLLHRLLPRCACWCWCPLGFPSAPQNTLREALDFVINTILSTQSVAPFDWPLPPTYANHSNIQFRHSSKGESEMKVVHHVGDSDAYMQTQAMTTFDHIRMGQETAPT